MSRELRVWPRATVYLCDQEMPRAVEVTVDGERIGLLSHEAAERLRLLLDTRGVGPLLFSDGRNSGDLGDGWWWQGETVWFRVEMIG